MGYDAFLQIDGIKGDSTDDKHKDWIEILSYNTGITQAAGALHSAQGSHTGGRADLQDFVVTKRLDSASPVLATHCCNGKHIPKITLELCRAMEDKTVFMTYTLEESIVSSINTSGSSHADSDPIPMETITFRFGSIKWEYTPSDTKGKKLAAVKGGWSTVLNKVL